MVDDRLERSGQPDVLCDLRVRARVRLSQAEGGEADARRAPQGQGRRGQRHPRGDGTQRRGAARVRPVGNGPPGYVALKSEYLSASQRSPDRPDAREMEPW